ncbi:Uncharacterised protein [uncultured archaeon]|nr:Uncharacterised protein [uncultured archaeon]
MVDGNAGSDDWLFGSHKNSKEYKDMFDRYNQRNSVNPSTVEAARRQSFRIELYKNSDEKFEATKVLKLDDLYLLRRVFAHDNEMVAKDAYRIITGLEDLSVDFRMAVIKECEKREMLEVIVLAAREKLPDRLQSAAERAKVAIMMSFSHAGKGPQQDGKFAVRSSVANRMKQI